VVSGGGGGFGKRGVGDLVGHHRPDRATRRRAEPLLADRHVQRFRAAGQIEPIQQVVLECRQQVGLGLTAVQRHDAGQGVDRGAADGDLDRVRGVRRVAGRRDVVGGRIPGHAGGHGVHDRPGRQVRDIHVDVPEVRGHEHVADGGRGAPDIQVQPVAALDNHLGDPGLHIPVEQGGQRLVRARRGRAGQPLEGHREGRDPVGQVDLGLDVHRRERDRARGDRESVRADDL
jgi:hypothetical protein